MPNGWRHEEQDRTSATGTAVEEPKQTFSTAILSHAAHLLHDNYLYHNGFF
ncbi:MAG TPA: hypothetical protein VE445_01690 [Nitrososphaeraceae archaeon]|nr:hypothetical protein [Nitrososphaeraceae archaeon]